MEIEIDLEMEMEDQEEENLAQHINPPTNELERSSSPLSLFELIPCIFSNMGYRDQVQAKLRVFDYSTNYSH